MPSRLCVSPDLQARADKPPTPRGPSSDIRSFCADGCRSPTCASRCSYIHSIFLNHPTHRRHASPESIAAPLVKDHPCTRLGMTQQTDSTSSTLRPRRNETRTQASKGVTSGRRPARKDTEAMHWIPSNGPPFGGRRGPADDRKPLPKQTAMKSKGGKSSSTTYLDLALCHVGWLPSEQE